MPELRIFYSKVNLSWGFIVRYLGTSASQPSYLLPPPTTVVGAFGYPLLRLLGGKDYAELETHERGRVLTKNMKALLGSTLAASCGIPPMNEGLLVGVSTYQEISRIVGLPYKGESEAKRFVTDQPPKDIARAMPVQAIGASYGPKAVLDLFWVIDAEKLAKELGVKIGDIDSIGPLAVRGVSRIGSKEGIVSVLPDKANYTSQVEILKPGDRFRSYMYVPATCVELLDESYAHQVILPDIKYVHTTFHVPALAVSGSFLLPLSKFLPMFKLIEPCKAYTFVKGKDEGVIGVM